MDDSPYYVPPDCKVVIDGELAFRISKILESVVTKRKLQALKHHTEAQFWAKQPGRDAVADRLMTTANASADLAKREEELLRQFDAAMRKGAKEHKT